MNTQSQGSTARTGRLERLLDLLGSDPENLNLLVDSAEAALAENRPEIAADLLERHVRVRPLSPQGMNLAGLAAMQVKRFDTAAEAFGLLLDEGFNDASVCFNLAWCRAMLKDFDGAEALLTDAVTQALGPAAMLHVQVLHEQGRFTDAAEKARLYLGLHPDDGGLMAAVSVLALDIDDEELAARCAAKGGDHPDAMTTRATLALGADQPAEALAIFNRVLSRNEHIPRAWIGRGLARLVAGDAGNAAADIDRGAEMFESHLGSWIAAGWAHVLNGDIEAGRARFQRALELDPRFAESHGSLAVLDILEGRADEGRSRSEIALRLDRTCYSAALAKVLLATGAGDAESARRIFEMAVNMPVDESGRTITQALAGLGMN